MNKNPGVRGISVVVVFLMVLAMPVPLVRMAKGTTTTGVTEGLVKVGQLIRDDSTGIPVVGFGATDGGSGEILLQVEVSFAGLGNTGNLEPLNTDQSVSGVAIYRDEGNTDDELDIKDPPVPQANIQAISWQPGNVVRIQFRNTGNVEPVPDIPSGRYEWFILIRTSSTIADGTWIITAVRSNSIVFSSGGGTISQPSQNVVTNALQVSVTRCMDITGDSMGGSWVGYRGVEVNYATPIGVHMIGGPYETLRWMYVRDSLTDFNNGDFGTGNNNRFWALSTDSAVSGVGVYRNDGSDPLRFDPQDTPIPFQGITWVNSGPGNRYVKIDFTPGKETLPYSDPWGFTYFIVVRTGLGAQNGNQFRVEINANEIGIEGSAGDGSGTPETASTPETPSPQPRITVDRAVPWIYAGAGWSENSPYLSVRNNILYFSDRMGTTTVYATVRGTAGDADSGLTEGVARMEFSNEPSLASSPGIDWSPSDWEGSYGINITSNDTSSPVTAVLYDRVGNAVSIPFRYIEDLNSPTITPNPGWTYISGQPPFWIDTRVSPSIRLWFSDWFFGTGTERIVVNFADPDAGLQNASATSEPSLEGGPLNYGGCSAGTWNNFGSATVSNNCRVEYAFTTSSTNASDPVTIYAYDTVGNFAAYNFSYSEDNEPPLVTITSPGQGDVLSGTVVFRAKATDRLTVIDSSKVQISIDGGAYSTMFLNGTEWEFPVATGQYSDGTHRVVVRADDMVGNRGTATLDVIFANGAPVVSILAPENGDIVSGTVNVTAVVSSGLKVTSVELRIDSGGWVKMSYDPVTNRYYYAWVTSQSGVHTISVRGWAGGSAGNVDMISVVVDNDPPAATPVYPLQGAEISGTRVVQLKAEDIVGMEGAYLIIGKGGFIQMTYNPLSGYYEYTWDTRDTPDGIYDLGFIAIDKAGNNATATVTGLTVDNTPPSLVILSPGPDEILSGIYTVNVSSSDAGSGFNTSGGVFLRVDNAGENRMIGGPPVWSFYLDTANYSDGRHALTIVSRDDAGNSVSEGIAFVIDNTFPEVAILSPVDSEFVEGVYTFQVFIKDTVSTDKLNITVTSEDSQKVVLSKIISPAGDTVSLKVNTNVWPDGNYSISATASDLAGHTSSDLVIFMVDNHPPVLSIISPVSGCIVSGIIDVKALASDPFLDTVEKGVDGSGWSDITKPLDTTIYPDGQHTLTVVATDLAGHVTEQSIIITIDNAPPQVAILAPVSGSTISGVVMVQASVADTVGISSVKIETGTISGNMAFDTSRGVYWFILDTSKLPDGKVSITITVSDRAAHNSTATVDVTIDNTLPPPDYWSMTLQATPFLIFLLILIALIIFLILLRTGRLRAWWHATPKTEKPPHEPTPEPIAEKEKTPESEPPKSEEKPIDDKGKKEVEPETRGGE